MLKTIFLILFAACITGTTTAQLSFLDPTFGNNGVVLKDVRSWAIPSEMIRQNDGKLLVAGLSKSDGLITRFLSNGQPDLTFGDSSNVIIVNPYSGGTEFYDIIEMGDRIIAGGWQPTATTTNVLIALKQNGGIDSSFALNGMKHFAFANAEPQQYIRSLARVNDSQFVVMGSCYDTVGNFNIHLVKLDRNGNFVTNFGNNGHVLIDHQDRNDYGFDVIADTKGSIYIVGTTISLLGSKKAMVVKLKPDGSLDPAFASQGKLIQNLTLAPDSGVDWNCWNTIAWQRNNLILGGYCGNFAVGVMVMQRINTNGLVDSSFADNGIMRTNLCAPGPGVAIKKLLVTPENKIMAGCTSNCGPGFDMFLAGFSPSGLIDSTFGINGNIRIPSLQGDDEQTTGLILNPDGTICQAAICSESVDRDIAIVKYKKQVPPPTGIATPEQSNAQLFPNVLYPGESITLRFRERLSSQGQGAFYDLSGRQLFSFSLPRNTQQTSINIPKHTAPGMYLLKLLLNGRTTTERIVIK